MFPILLMTWAGSQNPVAGVAPAWPMLARIAHPGLFFSVVAALHALPFVGTIWWLAGAVTRVEAIVTLLCALVTRSGCVAGCDRPGPSRRRWGLKPGAESVEDIRLRAHQASGCARLLKTTCVAFGVATCSVQW